MIALTSHFVLLSGYDSLEQRNALRTADRIEKVLQIRVETLTASARVMSLAARTRPLSSVFNDKGADSHFHSAAIVSSKGVVLQAVNVPYTNLKTGDKFVPLRLNTKAWLAKTGLLSDIKIGRQPDKPMGRILQVGDTLAGSVVVVPWRGDKNQAGFLVATQILNNNYLGDLGRMNNLNSALEIRFNETAADTTVGATLAGDLVKIQVPLLDLSGKPYAILATKLPQTIRAEGRDNISALILSVSIATVISGAFFWLFMSRTILRRLENFTADVQGIGDRVDRRVGVDSSDEIGWLATQVNKLIERQAAAQREIEDREQELRLTNENLEVLVSERTTRLGELNNVLENAVEGIARFNETGKIIETNQVFSNMLGFTAGEMIGQNWEQLMSFTDLDRIYEELEKSITGRVKTQFDADCIRRDSSHVMIEVTAIPQRSDDNAYLGMYWFVRDITERKRLEARITFQAFNDELTGLPNRSMFAAHLETELRATRGENELAVLLFDVDNFKYINDSLGHNEGDRLLGLFADRLRDLAPRGSVLARISGDEFAMLVPDCTPDMAADVANLVFRKMRPPVMLGSREIFITCTVGIALNNAECGTVESIFKGAETAMYEAKSRGKAGFAMYHSSMNESIFERVELELGLRRAIELNEFHMVYQPIVELSTGQTVGAEALIRWDHPERGLVSPAKFIPIAEETGLIIPLGEFVLREACAQTNRILKAFPDSDFVMSVNLSARQLLVPDITKTIMTIIEKAGIKPQNLKIEITESAMMEDIEIGIARLESLRDLGFQLAVDDFGTGHSSLSYLRRLPVHNVKIDQSFVGMLGVDNQPKAIVRAVIQLGQALNLNITGEGVETVEQLEILKELGCDFGQGYYFAKPLEETAFIRDCLQSCHWQQAA